MQLLCWGPTPMTDSLRRGRNSRNAREKELCRGRKRAICKPTMASWKLTLLHPDRLLPVWERKCISIVQISQSVVFCHSSPGGQHTLRHQSFVPSWKWSGFWGHHNKTPQTTSLRTTEIECPQEGQDQSISGAGSFWGSGWRLVSCSCPQPLVGH